ncbi:MAG: branched-chain amino acid ABC transporter permease [Lachnospiraceae bacterium]|nr:branched-chain amino acid ABC transporter permease [Lachnospiraceae bacterium]
MKSNKKLQSNLITFGMVIILYVICQSLAAAGILSNSMKGLLIQFCYYIIMAVSLNLTVGILGELSLGHAGFMCIGAYTYGIFAKVLSSGNLSRTAILLISLVLAAIIAAFFGFLIGIPVLRLKGDYLAIVTLAFGEIIKNVTGSLYIAKDSHGLHFSLNGTSDMVLDADNLVIIDGPKGITGLTSGVSFTLGTILVIITLIVVLNLINSRTGRAVMAIRDNRIAAEATGINVTKYKMLAFTISASLAGVAGVLYAGSLSTLTSTSKNFGYNMSIMILVYVVLGGIGSIRGSVIATVILVLLPEKLRFVNSYRMLIYAIVLIAMMILNWSPSARAWREKMINKIKSGKKVKEAK